MTAPIWRKATASGANSCVEVSFDHWRKATASAAHDCVEVAHTLGCVAVRDSKDPDGPILHFTPTEFSAFIAGVKSNEFDLPGGGSGGGTGGG